MTISPIRLLLVVLLAAGAVWFAFDQVLQQRDSARSERDQAQFEAEGVREVARLAYERMQQAAANDLKHTQELADARKQNLDLRRAVDAGHQRLLVKATCPAPVPAHSGAGSVADAGAAELSADARPDYFTLVDQLAVSRQMILGLQDHARLCQR
ncbi:MAG: lysis system i-spanin subunit Rz [Pseudomonas qingdaonensis]|uniref:lysis system i-spanin subunit Rz n=1 Tax=Pseudomonas qingdaonensis TaxID=2056231 RepID=UPI001E45F78D